jgi:polyisoprenoid-binding protein YceI
MATQQWKTDPVHSEVQFKVKHLMLTTVTGHFKNFEVIVETENDDFTEASKIEFTAEINSISTNNEQRDTHLKSADFFQAEQYAELKFIGRKYEKAGDVYKLYGDLTIKDITKPMTVNVDYAGIVLDPYGQTKAGFTVEGKLSRKEFGLTWNAVTEAGQVVVSDDIRLHCEIQLVKQAEM